MGMKTNLSLKMVVVAVFIVLAFAVAGLTAVTLLTGSPVLAKPLYIQTRLAWLQRLNASQQNAG
jgi:hypothetical protein